MWDGLESHLNHIYHGCVFFFPSWIRNEAMMKLEEVAATGLLLANRIGALCVHG
jgi:hypothetical protein